MTRINLVRPEDLADQHLFAEWRESKMIVPAALRSLKASTATKDISPQYTLNQGHVKFFYNKLLWLRKRYVHLGHELTERGYQYTPWEFGNDDYYYVYNQIPQIDWLPSKRDIQINVERISQRLRQKPDWYRYYGELCSPEYLIDKYNQQLLIDVLDSSVV